MSGSGAVGGRTELDRTMQVSKACHHAGPVGSTGSKNAVWIVVLDRSGRDQGNSLTRVA